MPLSIGFVQAGVASPTGRDAGSGWILWQIGSLTGGEFCLAEAKLLAADLHVMRLTIQLVSSGTRLEYSDV